MRTAIERRITALDARSAQAIEAKRNGYAQLHDFFAQGADIDLGGLAVAVPANGNRLSTYLDIAMMGKGSGLMF